MLYRLRHTNIDAWQASNRQQLIPPDQQRQPLGHQQQTLPLEHLILRSILRCRHFRSRSPLPCCHLPSFELPRRPRWKPRSLRPLLDRYHRRRHPLPYRHNLAIFGKGGKETLHLRFHPSLRSCRSDLRIHLPHSCCTLGCSQVVQSRVCQLAGVCVSIRLCELDLDSCCSDLLVTRLDPKLGLCRRRTCCLGRLFGQKPVSCAQCHRCQDEQGSFGRRRGFAFWPRFGHQDSILRVSHHMSLLPKYTLLIPVADTVVPPRRTRITRMMMTR